MDRRVDEARLIETLRRIEALFAGATTDGERIAAEEAKKRILRRLREAEAGDPPAEYRFKLVDDWSRRVFIALLRRYGIEPYRYPRQRRTTVMAKLSRTFVNETLWPEFEQLSKVLREHLEATTDRIISEVLHGDISEVQELREPAAKRRLPK